MANEKKVCMKSKILLVAALVFAMSFLGCGGGSNGESEEEVFYPISFTDQQLYVYEPDTHNKRLYDGPATSLLCWAFYGSTGVLNTGGTFSFTVTSSQVQNATFEYLQHIISLGNWPVPADLQAVQALRLNISRDTFGMIYRGYRYHGAHDTVTDTREVIHEQVKIIYVDRPININFPGYTSPGFFGLPGTIFEPFNETFQQGWNFWHVKTTRTDDYDPGNSSWTFGDNYLIMAIGNPGHLKWFIEECCCGL